jgi:hypothetical protein
MTGQDLISQACWTALASAFGIGGTVAYARWLEPHWLQIVERDLPVAFSAGREQALFGG